MKRVVFQFQMEDSDASAIVIREQFLVQDSDPHLSIELKPEGEELLVQ